MIFFYCIISYIADKTFDAIPTSAVFYVFSFFTILEYTLFALFLYLDLKEKTFRYVMLLGSLIFYSFAIYSLLHKNLVNFDSLPASVECILLIIYSIFFLYEQMKDPSIFYIYYSKAFWIIIAFFIYFSSTLFLFIYAASLANLERSNYWNINFIFNILKNIFFSISFVMKEGKKTQHPIETLYPDLE